MESALASVCRRNAVHVLQLAWATHPHVGFDAAGIGWLDRFIEGSRYALADDMIDEFAQLAGCFYGECLIAEFGGTWAWSGGRLGICMEPMGFTFPCVAVGRQVRDASAASISTAFLYAVDYLAEAA